MRTTQKEWGHGECGLVNTSVSELKGAASVTQGIGQHTEGGWSFQELGAGGL